MKFVQHIFLFPSKGTVCRLGSKMALKLVLLSFLQAWLFSRPCRGHVKTLSVANLAPLKTSLSLRSKIL